MNLQNIASPNDDGTRELVLKSGRFAKIRPITVADRVACQSLRGYPLILGMALQIATIDDEKIKAEELLEMFDAEASPFLEVVAEMLIAGAVARGLHESPRSL